MRLYQFNSAKHSLSNIRNRRLKISKINELNDPFDCKPARDPEALLNGLLEDHWSNLANAIGILCFSEDWKQPLMWGHYADSHRGICLGFDVVDSGTAIHVDYSSPERVKIEENVLKSLACEWMSDEHKKRSGELSLGKVRRNDVDAEKIIRNQYYEQSRPIFRRKHPDWSYEKEVRLAYDITKTEADSDGHQFQPWGDELVLREVILGVHCRVIASEIRQHLPPGADVSIFKTKLHASRFEITRDKITG